MNVVFAGEGPRDKQVMPRLAVKAAPSVCMASFEVLKDVRLLKRGSGLDRKLAFVIKAAIDDELDGVIATTDRDKDKSQQKLKQLRRARDQHRNNPALPPMRIALGEAVPHAEAWLLDDVKAVRTALQLPNETPIPSVTRSNSAYPKDELDSLCEDCPRSEKAIELLAEIAELLDEGRCIHRKATGLADFLAEVRAEFATDDAE